MALPVSVETLGAFTGLWFLSALAPGGNSAFTLSVSARYGFWAGISGALGYQTASLFYIVLVGAGLGALLAASAVAFELLRWIGVFYLFYLGYKSWTADPAMPAQSAFDKIRKREAYTRAMMISMTNPKVMIAFAVIFPQFMDLSVAAFPQLMILGAACILSSLLAHVIFSTIGSYVGRFTYTRRRRRISNRIFGGIFVGAGMALAGFGRSG